MKFKESTTSLKPSLIDYHGTKNLCSDEHNNLPLEKRSKTLFVDSKMETLKECSRDVSMVLSVNSLYYNDTKTCDDVPVPIRFWIHWLNTGICTCLTIQQWNQHVIVFQDIFTFTLEENTTRSFTQWFRCKLKKNSVGNNSNLGMKNILVESCLLEFGRENKKEKLL